MLLDSAQLITVKSAVKLSRRWGTPPGDMGRARTVGAVTMLQSTLTLLRPNTTRLVGRVRDITQVSWNRRRPRGVRVTVSLGYLGHTGKHNKKGRRR